MKPRTPYRLPDEQQKTLKKAKWLEWATIFFMLTITVVMYRAMGSSQAMKTAWVEDVLALIPPIVFLVATRYRDKPPNERFPYGYHRGATVAFLAAATALLILGLYLLIDSSMSLIQKTHPTIGTLTLFGERFWMGWVMIAALIYSMIPPLVLGRMKLQPAKELHEKTLYAGATMNQDDWLTALAALVGVLGIGIGWWWADSVAAAFISLNVLKDGVMHLKRSVGDLVNQRPTKVGQDEPEEVAERVRRTLEQLHWVAEADVRLRGEGHVFAGEAYVVPRDTDDLVAKLEAAADQAASVDWRLYDVVVTAVSALDERGADVRHSRKRHPNKPTFASEQDTPTDKT